MLTNTTVSNPSIIAAAAADFDMFL